MFARPGIFRLKRQSGPPHLVISGDAWAKEEEGGVACARTRSVRVAQLAHRCVGFFGQPREKSRKYLTDFVFLWDLLGFNEHLVGFNGI